MSGPASSVPPSVPAPGARCGALVAVLAAGAGSRFAGAGHKLLAELPARGSDVAATVVERAVDHARRAEIGPVVVITGAVPIVVPEGVTTRDNPAWRDGQATSLQVALDVARERGCDALVVGLGDQPDVGPAAWRAVADATGPIAVATYAGRRGNPVRLDRSVWELLPTSGDEGARQLMRRRPDLVHEVPCTGSAADIDTLEDLARWQNN